MATNTQVTARVSAVDPTIPTTARRGVAPWIAYLLACAPPAIGFFLVPDGIAQTVCIVALAAIAAAAVVIGIRRYRPSGVLAWRSLTLAMVLFGLGDILWFGDPPIDARGPAVGAADAVFLAAFVAAVIAIVLLVRWQPRGDARAELLEGTIIAFGLLPIVFMTIVEPYLQAEPRSPQLVGFGLAYGATTLAGISLYARLGFSSRARLPAYWLLAGALIAGVGSYALYASSSAYATGAPTDVLWVLSHLLVGLAALHPSMRAMGPPSVAARANEDPSAPMSALRLAVFAVAILIPMVIAVAYHDDRIDVEVAVFAVGGAFVLALARMHGLLRALHLRSQDLETTVDVLHESDMQRRLLATKVIHSQEEERRRIAGDIHDDPVQAITAAELRLHTLGGRLTDERQIAALAQVTESVRGAGRRLRGLMFDLHPRSLEVGGLAIALREYLDRLEESAQVRCTLVNQIDEEPGQETRTTLYRIAQEALTNVRKHATAKAIQVTLTRRSAGYAIMVADDGVGFDPDLQRSHGAAVPHLGMASMRERAEMAGARCACDRLRGPGRRSSAGSPTGSTRSKPALRTGNSACPRGASAVRVRR